MIEKIFSNYYKSKIALVDHDSTEYSYKNIAKDINQFNFMGFKKSICFLEGSNNYLPILFYIYCLKYKFPIFLVDNIENESQKKLIDEYTPKYIFLKNKLNKKGYFLKKKISSYYIYQAVLTNYIKINPKISLLLSTSGTLGGKKFVKLSLSNISINAKQIKKYLKINSKSITITTLPFNYSYGLSIINSHLISGAKIILNQDSVISREFKNKINKYNVTNFGGVPYTYSLLNKINFFETNYPSLIYITQAGGRLDYNDKKKLIDVTKKYKLKLFIMYGQTEASPRISYLPFEKLYKKSESIGIPVPGGIIKLKNNRDKIIRDSFTEGELIYYGKNVSLGNLNKSIDLSKGDKNKGILKTGDIGYFDNDNFFYITGRINRLAKIFGKRLNLDELQKNLNKKGISIICVTDDKFLKIYYDSGIIKNKLIDEIVNQTGLNKNFIKVRKIKKFIRNSSGKIALKNYE